MNRIKCSKRNANQVFVAQVRKTKRSKKGRLCGDLGKLCNHISAIINLKNLCVCSYCVALLYHACRICLDKKSKKPIALHYNSKQKESKGKQCFYHWHDDCHFGLAKSDTTNLLNGTKNKWDLPNNATVMENGKHVARFGG